LVVWRRGRRGREGEEEVCGSLTEEGDTREERRDSGIRETALLLWDRRELVKVLYVPSRL
jgi:hypothetical protein